MQMNREHVFPCALQEAAYNRIHHFGFKVGNGSAAFVGQSLAIVQVNQNLCAFFVTYYYVKYMFMFFAFSG